VVALAPMRRAGTTTGNIRSGSSTEEPRACDAIRPYNVPGAARPAHPSTRTAANCGKLPLTDAANTANRNGSRHTDTANSRIVFARALP
jgi:hypothetical protein